MPKATVALVHSKSCFVNLPLQWADALWDEPLAQVPGGVVLELSWRPDARRTSSKAPPAQCSAFVGWAGGCVSPASVQQHQQQSLRGVVASLGQRQSHGSAVGLDQETAVIELDVSFGQALGLRQGQQVNVSFVQGIAGAESVSVEPASPDDWEILELHAGYLEEQMLNQLRIVFPGQTFTVWIYNQTCITLKIVDTTPPGQKCMRLSESAEIIVAPKPREDPNRATRISPSSARADTAKPFALRFLPLDHHNFPASFAAPHPWEVIVSHFDAPPQLMQGSRVFLQHLDFNVVVRSSDLSESGSNSEVPLPPEQAASSFNGGDVAQAAPRDHPRHNVPHAFAAITMSQYIPRGHVLLGDVLVRQLALEPFDQVRVQHVASIDAVPKRLDIVTKSKSISAVDAASIFKGKFKAGPVWSNPASTALIFDGMPLPLAAEDKDLQPDSIAKVVFFKDPETVPPPVFALRIADFGALDVGSRVNAGEAIPRYKRPTAEIASRLHMPGFEAILDESASYLVKCILLKSSLMSLNTPAPGALLIHGASGSGKTTISRTVAIRLAKFHKLYHKIVRCSQWKQLSPAKAVEAIESVFMLAAWHAPSLVILDDIDLLIPSETEIKPPNKRSRIDILRSMIANAPPAAAAETALRDALQNINFNAVASQMDGFTVADMQQIYERARHSSVMRRIKSKQPDAMLAQEDFVQALEGFKPSATRNIKLQSSGVSWDSIGGMEETKQMLLQTLQWPTLYPQIFASSPLRLRSGLLLYGYPGCGKTMLASAVAKECGLNFISVKGPELLNKYIGASEKAVRDLFERAQAAKPCCLFFDEFDSIAPRRGHDNTGVTDRVVNQMLTQMDGAEGLDGVFVLAATSRPDLIDPALLRPGRLDKMVLCDMPSYSDRASIIRAVCQRIPLAPSVSVDWLADRTDGFTGADIQGLLYSAQLAAIRDTMDDKLSLHGSSKATSQTQDTSTDSVKFVVCGGEKDAVSRFGGSSAIKAQILTQQHHIEGALEHARPSVSEADRKRLAGIYAKFGKGESDVQVGVRTSLA
ncbi:Peroxisome biosynthesis protein pex1 [Polyrhizophydium stewartii]|uniref:Peroxisomal ATPase PEX1 n=1 Tax=Polyrhizophydium stewartii TaxID=2732419 RepID=A0ABR4NHQ6_9FUNG